MTHTFFMTDDQVTLINLSNGNRVTIHSGDSRFAEFSKLVAEGDFVKAESLDVKAVVATFASDSNTKDFRVEIKNGVGSIYINNVSYLLEQTIVNKIIKMQAQGFDSKPLIAFLKNLYNNPSKVAVQELYLFLEKAELPITTDGCFIAYKVIRNNYLDIHSSTFDNSVGAVCSMPRFEVDDVRSNTCSAGLHFCSRSYLSQFGSGRMDDDRCVLVKINPADVVSIPSDYNNAKGRTCRYEVVGEVTAENWRSDLTNKDFTESAVVDDYDEDEDEYDEDEFDEAEAEYKTFSQTLASRIVDDGYYFDDTVDRWRNESGRMVSRVTLSDLFDVDVSDIVELE